MLVPLDAPAILVPDVVQQVMEILAALVSEDMVLSVSSSVYLVIASVLLPVASVVPSMMGSTPAMSPMAKLPEQLLLVETQVEQVSVDIVVLLQVSPVMLVQSEKLEASYDRPPR